MFIIGGPFGGWDDRISGEQYADRLEIRSPPPQKIVKTKPKPPAEQKSKLTKPAELTVLTRKSTHNMKVRKLKNLKVRSRNAMKIGKGRLQFLSPRQ